MRIMVFAALLAGACQSSSDVPTVAVDVVLKDVKVKADVHLGELAVRVRLTPDQVEQIMQGIASEAEQGSANDGSGSSPSGRSQPD